MLVHEGLPRQADIQIHHHFHAVSMGILGCFPNLVMHLGLCHLDAMADARGQQTIARMPFMQINKSLVAVGLEIRGRQKPAADAGPRHLDGIVFLAWQVDTQ